MVLVLVQIDAHYEEQKELIQQQLVVEQQMITDVDADYSVRVAATRAPAVFGPHRQHCSSSARCGAVILTRVLTLCDLCIRLSVLPRVRTAKTVDPIEFGKPTFVDPRLSSVKLEFHGTDTDTDTGIMDAPIV